MRSEAAGLSDVGLQREHNEDSFAVVPQHELFIVADGMGGHRAGDVASRLASESITEFFRKATVDDVTWPFHFDTSLTESENRLLTAIRLANRQVYEHSLRSAELQGMGTTVVGALFDAERHFMYVGHVGDSRAYRVRGGQITQLTRDHSLVNDYLAAMPDMPEEQRSELPKNVITRALGMQDAVEVDLTRDEAQVDDVYVLCSDGLSGMVHDADILEVVQTLQRPGVICSRLVTMANEHGGDDNVTAVVVKIVDGASNSNVGLASACDDGAVTETPPTDDSSACSPKPD